MVASVPDATNLMRSTHGEMAAMRSASSTAPAVHRGEIRAEGCLAARGFDHLRVRVSDERRAPGHRHVEKLATLGVPHPRAFAALDDWNELGGNAVLTVRAGGEESERS